MAEAVIEARGLSMHYGDLVAVDGLDLAVERGEIFGLLGPNGAGKTTTIEILEGLRRPTSGEAHTAGVDVVRSPARVSRRIGVQLQSTSLFDLLTVRETLKLYHDLAEKPLAVDAVLDALSLREKSRALVRTLSGGQQQRLALAIAMINDPEVVFLDEPTTGLDPQARRSLWDFVEQIRREGRTVVLTTHNMEEAEALCDRLAIMDRGRIIALGTPRQLVREAGTLTAVEFAWTDPGGDIQAEVSRLSGVERAAGLGERLIAYSSDPAATVGALLAWSAGKGRRLDDLSVRSATLEDVFLKLTGRSLREA